ncbi:MAG TPA: ArsI/CadI family heavy metal resistance metalloenzyme [Planctomycetota bacterium]
MMNDEESAAKFATRARVHVALATRDLARSTAFYRTLLGQEPTKTRAGYAKFEVAEPPLNLSLNESAAPTAPSNGVTHFGIQVKSTAAVKEMIARLAAAGLPTRVEEEVSCCYAVQSKVWAEDPDGNKWETYVLLSDDAPQRASSAGGGCCAPSPVAFGARKLTSP